MSSRDPGRGDDTWPWALLAGILFGAGLVVSGMSDPAKVLGFLDVAGDWNPSLAFVMGGAVVVAAPAFAWVRSHGRSLRGRPISLPDRRRITSPLIVGSLLFGIGWGLVGLCPGPAVVVLIEGAPKAAVFFVALAVGLAIVSRIRKQPEAS